MKTQKLIPASAVLALVLNLNLTWLVQAADGDLDTTFSFDGKVTTEIGHEAAASAIAIDANGKIVAAGYSISDFALARYNSDGTLDSSFGTGGKVITDFGDDEGISAIAIDASGKIIAVGGSSDGTKSEFALARYNEDGSLDPSFGTGGKVITDFGGTSDYASAIALDGNGKIVVAGRADPNASFDFAVARYNGDGSLDSSFGTNGKVTTDFAVTEDQGFALAIDTSGKIIVAGRSTAGGTFDFALARYNGDGSLDTDFNANGKVITDFAGDLDQANAVIVDANGRIVVAGFFTVGINSTLALARYSGDGGLDPGFGTGGKVITDLAGNYEGANAVAIDANGKIIVAGEAMDDFALVRYNGDGSLDSSFGTGGKVTTDFAASRDIAFALAIDGGGKIVLAGLARPNDFVNLFGLARYLSSAVPRCTIKCPAGLTQANDANQCGAIVNYPAPAAGATCGTITCAPASGSFFPAGTTTVTCTNNAAVECSFTVTVNDTQPPTIACPANLTVPGTSPSGVIVNYPPPTAADNCAGVTVSCIPASGSVFPVGTTAVTCTATDAASNAASCTFSVTVERADLAVSKIAAVSKANPGQTITYTNYAQNLGPGSAREVVISDAVPANCTFVSATGPVSFAPAPGANGTVVWSYNSLPSGAAPSVTMTVKVSTKGKGSVTNTATISSPSYDPVLANNSATVTTRLPTQGK